MAEITRIENIRYEQETNGEPVLTLEIDGQWTSIMYGQKLLEFGAVFLGSAFRDFVFIVPPDPLNGRLEPMEQRGFTNDVRVVNLVKRLISDVDNGLFQVGPVRL